MFYGKRPNSQLLIYSGFVFPKNRYDTMKIRAQPDRDDPLIREKLTLLTRFFEKYEKYILSPSQL